MSAVPPSMQESKAPCVALGEPTIMMSRAMSCALPLCESENLPVQLPQMLEMENKYRTINVEDRTVMGTQLSVNG